MGKPPVREGDSPHLESIIKPAPEKRTSTAQIIPIVKDTPRPIENFYFDEEKEGTETQQQIKTTYEKLLAKAAARELRQAERTQGNESDEAQRKQIVDLTEITLGDLLLEQARTTVRATKFETLVERDNLTELKNKRGAQKAFEIVREREERGDTDGATVLVRLDLDSFKLVNDLSGHAKGDEVLREVGQNLQNSINHIPEMIRPTDTFIRFSGDEYGMILTDVKAQKDKTLEETIEIILTRLIEEIEKVNDILDEKLKGKVFITASVGYEIADKDFSNPYTYYDERSDEASKEAKKYKAVKTSDGRDLKKGSDRIVNRTQIKETRRKKAEELGMKEEELTEALTIACFKSGTDRPTNDALAALDATDDDRAEMEKLRQQQIDLLKRISARKSTT